MRHQVKTPYFFALISPFIAMFCGAIFAEESAEISEGNPPISLRDSLRFGERLTYQVRWNGFPAATIHGRVWKNPRIWRGRETALLEINLEVNDFIAMFYPLKLTVRSLTEIDTGASQLFTRQTHERRYAANDRIVFAYDNHNAMGKIEPLAIAEKIQNGEAIRQETHAIPPAVCDPAALAWYLRALPLTENSHHSIFIYDRYWQIRIGFRVVSEENLTIAGFGKIACWRIVPEIPEVATAEVGGLWLDKKTHIITRAWLKTPYGEITVKLSAAENSPITAAAE